MRQTPMELVVMGASGRMGRLVCARAVESDDFHLRAAVAHGASHHLGGLVVPGFSESTIVADYNGDCDVIIDFSTGTGTGRALELAANASAGVLIAATGLSAEIQSEIKSAATKVPVLIAPNTSPGIAVMTQLVEQAVRALGSSWSVEIVESHHQHKRDAPSGTAIHLADAARRAGAEINPDQIRSLRGGDVVGEHTIRLTGEGEYLEIHHSAIARTLFADGALQAARWLVGQPAGMYSMNDVMGVTVD